MKYTGFVRRLDELGRLVIPNEVRKLLSLKTKDGLEMSVDGEMIVLKKDVPKCTFCGSVDDLIIFKEKNVCMSCSNQIKGL